MKKVGILYIHGIGDNQNIAESDFQKRVASLTQALRSRLGPQADEVVFETVFWQQLIQPRQTEIFHTVKDLDINGKGLVNSAMKLAKVRGITRSVLKIFKKTLRKMLSKLLPAARGLLVSTLGDAAATEHNAHLEGSVYTKIQNLIRDGLLNIYNAAEQQPIPVIVVSQSYGAHLISNYIWDSQAASANRDCIGVWAHKAIDDASQQTIDFLQFKTLRRFFSAANNIALFIRKNYSFH